MGIVGEQQSASRAARAPGPDGLCEATLLRTLPEVLPAGLVAISPDARFGLSGGGSGPARLWDLTTGTLLRELGGDGAGCSGLWTDGRKVVASGEGKIIQATMKGWVSRFDTRNPQNLHPLSRGPHHDRSTGASSDRGAVVVGADGRFALGICMDRALRMWDLTDGACVRTLRGHAVWPNAVWLAPDARRAVSAGADGEIRVWDLDGGTCAVFPHPDSWVDSVCLSADGRRVLVGGDHRGHTMWLIDAVTGEFVRGFEDVRDPASLEDPEDRSGEVLAVRLTSDGRFAVSGEDDGRIRIRETSTGRCVRTLDGHTEDARGIALTPDDRFLLSGGSDGTLRLWQLGWGL